MATKKIDTIGARAPKPGLQWKGAMTVPQVELEGWITEASAALLRHKLFGNPGEEPICPQTIGKWRRRGLIAAINFADRIWMVRRQDIIDMPELPEGNPSQRNAAQVLAMDKWLAKRVEFENSRSHEIGVTVKHVTLSTLKGWNKKAK